MMMFLALAAYFALACFIAAVLLLPSFRAWTGAVWGGVTQKLGQVGAGLGGAIDQGARGGLTRAETWATSLPRWLKTHRLGLLIVLTLLVLPPVLVFSIRGFRTLDSYADDTTPSISGEIVSALLQGEQLVPPPPLPPEVFTTAEVKSIRPELSSADRRWDLLDAEFRQRLLLVYKLMRDEHGYDMVLLEGYRSPERQTALAKMGANVTNAAAWQSYHQYGMAADSAFMRDGKLVISERDPWAMKGYELYGAVAQQVGLTWGGRWQNMDLGHVELRGTRRHRPQAGGQGGGDSR